MKTEQTSRDGETTVLVGTKPVMNYVLAVATQFNAGASEVCIMARGRAISRAVDTAEIAVSRFLSDTVKKGLIVIGTEVVDTESGPTNVSTIDIHLVRI